ncbi:MAG TPA: extensin family protein [Stellaceae bacterium]|nr:extensin family protein [Stellaceae bacterium]
MRRSAGWLSVAAAVTAAALLAACGTTPQSTRPPPPPAPAHGPACLAKLRQRPLAIQSIAFPAQGECVIDTPLRVHGLGIALSPAATMSCGLADRLADFNQAVIQPAAQRRFGVAALKSLDFGAYACRAESSGRDRISQHGFGRAIDVAGFVLADGTRISVEDDWDDDGPRGDFIHDIARGACDYFSVVLTPDSNADHRNHLHLDVGPDRLCGPA